MRSIMNSDSTQERFLDLARSDLEKLMKLNKDNQPAREKLEEVVKESVKIKIKIRDAKKNEKTENLPKIEKTEKNENKDKNDVPKKKTSS